MLAIIRNNKKAIIWVFVWLIVVIGLNYAKTIYASSKAVYGDLFYGEQVALHGDLQAGGVNDPFEYALVTKVERTIESVIKGDNYKIGPFEMVVFNLYNFPKGIVSGDRGFLLIPRNEELIKDLVTMLRGNPEYVWEFVNKSTHSDAQKARYTVRRSDGTTSDWINVATILQYSGGGGSNIVSLNRHTNKEWSAYNSGNLSGFDFKKPINTSVLRITDYPKIEKFQLNTGSIFSPQSSIEYDISTYGIYTNNNNKSSSYIYLNDKFGPNDGFSLPEEGGVK